ncbi:DUF4845 domain-containing protein [Pseudomonas fluvialis]|uniref:DUF4845 domain-containing protein n=1 Tax=Pseudomonas fluvialis TaxID=1793966 RepID=A0A2I0CQU8_9PSED|nr:DUF4845 domain-containing protein [Pseudomonas pharmacofabricae]PKF71540.1 DUF4845 domain-containing protein [Pseudomonas pharmacofabricae]
MQMARSQGGWSLLNVMLVLSLVAVIASGVFKMLPHYLDFMSLEEIITSVENDKAANVRTIGELNARLSKGMQVNSIRGIKLDEAVTIKIENNEFRVHLKYERREPFIRNLDLVARFDKEFRVRLP